MSKQSVGARDQAQRASGPSIPGLKEVLAAIRLSFATGEQGAVNVNFPFKVRIDHIRSQVVRALSDTNAGTVTLSNSVGDMADGVITHAAEAALGNEVVATPTTNRIIEKDTDLTLTPAKAKVGGKVQVTVHYTRMA